LAVDVVYIEEDEEKREQINDGRENTNSILFEDF